MKIRYIYLLFIHLSLIVASGCSTVLGPPDSETGVDEPPDFGDNRPRYDLFFEGQPNLAMLNAEGGYYIWRNGNTWHVRIAKSDKFYFGSAANPVFSGHINISKGIISNLSRRHVDVQNNIRQRQDNIEFSFRLRNDVEGFDFTVQPFGVRYCVSFDLRMNNSANPSIVHLGRSMFAPEVIPVESCVP